MLQHRERAVTITSFALVAPVFLFIVFGTLEMSRVLNAWMVITNEAREAARYGAAVDGAIESKFTIMGASSLAPSKRRARSLARQWSKDSWG